MWEFVLPLPYGIRLLSAATGKAPRTRLGSGGQRMRKRCSLAVMRITGWLYSDMQFPDPDDHRHKLLFATETSIQKPAQTPVFLDANWVDLWPLETDHPSRDLYAGIPFEVPTDSMARCTIARHGGRGAASAPRKVAPGQKLPGAINMGLADGHAELAKLENLWNYYWHLDWEPPATRPQ